MNPLHLIAMLVLGWLTGALLNYLADVLVQTRRLSPVGCMQCTATFAWHDYLRLKPCRQCGAARELRAWLVQIFATVALPVLWIFPPERLGFWLALPLFVYLALVITMDLQYRVVLHPVSIAGAIIGLGFGVWMNGLVPTLIGGAAGFGIMFGLYLLGGLFTKWMARRRGQTIDEVALGFGDVNLSGVLGLLLGWPKIWVLLLFAILLGGLVSALILLGMVLARRYQAFTAIPYAPFLVIVAVVFLFLA